MLGKSTAPLALFPEEIALFTETFDYLAAVTTNVADLSNVVVPRSEHIEAIQAVLDRWPAIHRFPGEYSRSMTESLLFTHGA